MVVIGCKGDGRSHSMVCRGGGVDERRGEEFKGWPRLVRSMAVLDTASSILNSDSEIRTQSPSGKIVPLLPLARARTAPPPDT